MGETPDTRGTGGRELPRWFYGLRALASLVVGVLVIVHETWDAGPANVILLVAALMLMGFTAADLTALYRAR
jgi:hypothetical protein